MNDDDITFELDTDTSITITGDTSSWENSFSTSPTSIYTSNGDVSIENKLVVDGVDVVQSIKDMQRVLGVVSRDLDKEEKYAGLKRAAKAYERELEKIHTFETLKDSK